MSHKMTISCEDYLADVELEEGLSVLVQDSGKVFRCITGHDGLLTWQVESGRRFDFPETQLQLQEIACEDSRAEKAKKVWTKAVAPTYLH